MHVLRITRLSAEAGDWEALYVGGVLKDQGHSLDTRMVCEALKGCLVGEFHSYEVSDEWLEEYMEFPELLEDVPVEVLL